MLGASWEHFFLALALMAMAKAWIWCVTCQVTNDMWEWQNLLFELFWEICGMQSIDMKSMGATHGWVDMGGLELPTHRPLQPCDFPTGQNRVHVKVTFPRRMRAPWPAVEALQSWHVCQSSD